MVSVRDSVVTVVNLLEIIIVINNMICSDTYVQSVHCIVDDRLIEILQIVGHLLVSKLFFTHILLSNLGSCYGLWTGHAERLDTAVFTIRWKEPSSKMFTIIFFVTTRSTGFLEDFTPVLCRSSKNRYFRIKIALSRIGPNSRAFEDRLILFNCEVPNDSDF